ncbi:hypothetical protein [Frigidibacter sp. MR17.24]|uniref:hypothetical protein n=1 Tax=Frigidibacter sp. MR17.24 TaxID=3127345 RepID=UPI003012A722
MSRYVLGDRHTYIPGESVDERLTPTYREAAIELAKMSREDIRFRMMEIGYSVATASAIADNFTQIVLAHQRSDKSPALSGIT